MKQWLWLAMTLCVGGCVSSPTAKTASTTTAAALSSMVQAESTFQTNVAEQIDKTIDLVAGAIVAKAVKQKISSEADNETKGNLIDIATDVENVENATRRMVTAFIAASGKNPEADVSAYLKNLAAAERGAADQLATSDPNAAKALRDRAAAIEAGATFTYPGEQNDLTVIATLSATKAESVKNLQSLKTDIQVLAAMHSVVNDWVMTDVTVSGKDVANLLEKNAQLLGPTASTTTQK